MKRLLLLVFSILPVIVWSLSKDFIKIDPAQAQKEYALEQNKIELALAEIALQASSGHITGEEAQSRIDQWVRANARRLAQQADRAAYLDLVAPVASEETRTQTAEPEVNSSPDDRRLAELDEIQNQVVEQLREKATSAEHLQTLIDEWAHQPEGKAVLDERLAIFSEQARNNPLGSQPIQVAVSEDAPPSEVASLDIQERIARRIQDIRSRHPEAEAEEFQLLIDSAKGEFEADLEEMSELMRQSRHERLAATVSKLRDDIANAENSAALPK